MKQRLIILLLFSFFISVEVSAQVLKRRPVPQKIKSPPVSEQGDFNLGTVPAKDRWKISPPPYEVNETGRWYDPFHQNKLKGDYPLIGQDIFLILTAVSDTLLDVRKLPTPSGVSSAESGNFNFFGDGEQIQLQQNFKFSFELYEGNTAFKPRDWEIKITPVFNINYLDVNERGAVNVNVNRGTTRSQTDFALQEALFEYHLLNVSSYYDFISFRAGIQPFTSDFRGTIFTDTNLSGRLFGNLANNRYQWNLVAFDMLEKSTNNDLNTLDRRHQEVIIGNLYAQDFLGILGWTHQLSVHWNHDHASLHYDLNGVLVRPDPAGAAEPHEVDAVYLGWASDGHIGRINVNHSLYFVVGEDDLNPIAGQRTRINAQMASTELSYDRDWYRLKGSFLYASGDGDPTDGTAKGFDSILDAPKFAGGENSFFHHNAIRLNGVSLTQRNSLLPDLRSSKTQGQSNFVNPGLLLFNVGSTADIFPQLRADLNVNYLRFMETAPLELFLNQANIRKDIGIDYSLGFQYRPFLNNQLIVNLAGAVFQPLGGFKDILTEETLFSVLVNTVVTF